MGKKKSVRIQNLKEKRYNCSTVMLKYILKLFVLLQLIVIFSWFVGERFFPIRETFLGKGLEETVNQPLVWSRANFDGFHYAKIARDGYQYLQQAFFPFYPKLIKFFQPMFHSFIISGIFVSSTFFILYLWMMKNLLEEEGEKQETIKNTLLFLVLFPTSFYLVSVYTESLFLFLVLLSFWLAKRKSWLLAGLTAGLASYTRPVGILLLPALVYEYYQSESKRKMKERILAAKEALIEKLKPKYLVYFLKSRWSHFKNLIFLSLSSWGLLSYMFYLKRTTGDWFYFARVQPSFGAQRSVNKVIMLYQVFWRYLKMIFTVNPRSYVYFNVWFEFLIALLFLTLLFLGWFIFKLRRSWMIFATLAYLLPTLTGTFSSMPRYVLACFPCFLVLAKLKLPKLIYFISGTLLLICTALFVRGYWIS